MLWIYDVICSRFNAVNLFKVLQDRLGLEFIPKFVSINNCLMKSYIEISLDVAAPNKYLIFYIINTTEEITESTTFIIHSKIN